MDWFACIFVIATIFILSVRRFRNKPKGYKKPPVKPKKPTRRADRRRYRHDEKAKFDAIVVGAGPSGLATAALLARLNWKILVVEQNEVAGGGMHTFTKDGFEFETGLHYLGQDGASIRLLNVICDKAIKFKQQGSTSKDHIYDCIRIGDQEIKFAAGITQWIKSLVKKFPEEEVKIHRYLKELRNV